MATVSGQVRLGGLQIAGAMAYDNRVIRYREGRATDRFQPASRAVKRLPSEWAAAPALSPMKGVVWQPGRQTGYDHRLGFMSGLRRGAEQLVLWDLAQGGRETGAALRFQVAEPVATERRGVYQVGSPVGTTAGSLYEVATRHILHIQDAWQHAGPAGIALTESFQPGTAIQETTFFVVPWGLGSRAQVGRVTAPPGGGGGEEEPPEAGIVVPIRRIYMVVNSIVLRRVSDDAELLAYGFSMSVDVESWTWSFNASLHKASLALVMASGPDPVELEAQVNGVPYRLLVGSVARSTRFPETRIAISGRGLAAILAAPHAPVQTFGNAAARTAQQLMADVLTVNGVSLGWSLDWNLTDWLVPGGAWSLQGTYMDALNDIATAAGGYIQPHATANTLRVLQRYPVAPWEWATMEPDIELPADAVSLESIEWRDKPAYNRVFVGGMGAGVFGPVTRAGSGGDLIAPQVVHALITHADVHRQRGLAELADTGRQAQVQLKLQVLPETGLIVPGTTLRYLAGSEAFVGIVRGTSLEWASSTMRQTITLETHDE